MRVGLWIQWLASAAYPKPPGLVGTKSRFSTIFQKLMVYGRALASAHPENAVFQRCSQAGSDGLQCVRRHFRVTAAETEWRLALRAVLVGRICRWLRACRGLGG